MVAGSPSGRNRSAGFAVLAGLNLRGDQLTELPASLRDLTALTWIDVSGNPPAGPRRTFRGGRRRCAEPAGPGY
ncbi:hypothetical protein ACPPVO_41615 [Dactylosporangium sp. McL0621]|uniref:hypothetical protein n=1 Tax=Dactylosporangium sp. McL0621 TaxID=3415678 RepID=UPI003CF4300B